MGVRISHDRYGIPGKFDDADGIHCGVPATRRADRVGVAEVEGMIAMLAAIEPA